MAKDKIASVQSILKQYSAAIQDPIVTGTLERVILDSPNLNYIFGGGFALSRIYEFFGPESGGKSVLSWYIGSHIQRRPKQNKVLLIDFEHTFDKKYAMSTGLDLSPDKLILVRPLHGEEGFTIAEGLIETGEIGLVIIDSLATIASQRQVGSEYGKAQMGSGAGLIAESLKKLNPYLSRTNTTMILINQIRADIGGFSPVPGVVATKTPGGFAPKFYASWRGKISKTKDITEKGIVIGNGIKVRNVKSKIGYPKRVVELVLRYDTGFSTMDEVIDFICKAEFGMATLRGAYIYPVEGSILEDLSKELDKPSWQGRAKLKEDLTGRPDLVDKARKIITAKFESTLDMDADIEQEEGTEELDDAWKSFKAPGEDE